MRKPIIFLIIFSIAVFMLVSCEKNSTESESVSQIILVWAYHDYDYWDYETDERVYIENTEAWGVVFADPLPGFDYLKLSNKISNSHEYWTGYIGFGEDARITSNFDPLEVEVKTSFGKVNGTISLPDTITDLSLSEYDTLQLGESFTISWSGNADFYSIYCEYEWIDDNDDWQYTDLDTIISGNSIIFPGIIFTHNGEISYIRVYQENGPLPKEGAVGNMAGDGSGFLYYENYSKSGRYTDDIVVGGGLYKVLGKNSLPRYSEKEIRERIHKNIEKKIGLPVISK